MDSPTIGPTARRTRTATARDIELFTETITRGVVAVDGTALVWREDLR